MRGLVLSMAMGALLLGTAASSYGQGRIEQRKDNQQQRIENGKADGSLTNREARRLSTEEAALDAKIRRDRKDGGGMTAQEKRAAERRQDNMSKKIYNQRHDKQTK